MSSSGEDKESSEYIDHVHRIVEACLRNYMTRERIIHTLHVEAKIDSTIIEELLRRLERENKEFFKAYKLRMVVRDQIVAFNTLLNRQVELMHRMSLPGVASFPLATGSHSLPMQHAYRHAPQQTAQSFWLEDTHHPGLSFDDGSSLHPVLQTTVHMAGHTQSVDVPPNMMLHRISNTGMIQGIDGNMVMQDSHVGNAAYGDGRLAMPDSPVGNAAYGDGRLAMPDSPVGNAAYGDGRLAMPDSPVGNAAYGDGRLAMPDSPVGNAAYGDGRLAMPDSPVGNAAYGDGRLAMPDSPVGNAAYGDGRLAMPDSPVGNAAYVFHADNNARQVHPAMADVSVASFSSVESNSQLPNGTLMDADASSFGFQGQNHLALLRPSDNAETAESALMSSFDIDETCNLSDLHDWEQR